MVGGECGTRGWRNGPAYGSAWPVRGGRLVSRWQVDVDRRDPRSGRGRVPAVDRWPATNALRGIFGARFVTGWRLGAGAPDRQPAPIETDFYGDRRLARR